MTLESVRVRRATRDDIPFLAWCNFAATSPASNFCYWDPLLEGTGTPTMQFVETVLRSDALAWGQVEDFFVVEQDGTLLAGASAFTMSSQDYRPLRLEQMSELALALDWTESALQGFQHAYTAVWTDPHDPSLAPQAPWIIECVAVIPEARGHGLVRVLFNEIFNQGRQLGHSHAGISVTTGNTAAQRAYEALGFQMYLTYGADYFDNAFPGTTKYRLRLEPKGRDQ